MTTTWDETTVNRNRIGQFADGPNGASVYGESDIDLSDDFDIDDGGRRVLENFSFDGDPDDVRELFDRANRIAMARAQKTGLHRSGGVADHEDARQEAFVWMLAAQRNRNNEPIVNPTGMARHAVNSRALLMATNGARHENSRALAALKKAEERMVAQQGGQPLSTQQRDALAARIRDEWPDQKRKPSKDFHMGPVMETAFSALSSDDNDFNPDRHLDDDPERLPNKGRRSSGEWTQAGLRSGDTLDLQFLSYAMLAEQRDAPLPATGTVSHAVLQKARAALKDDSGSMTAGIRQAIATWNMGETDERTEALFTPFAEPVETVNGKKVRKIDEGMRDEVCELLRSVDSQMAETLWKSASRISSVRSKERLEKLLDAA